MRSNLTQSQLVSAIADMGKGYAALLFGAGASRSSGVLLAREIVHDICSVAYCRHFGIGVEFREHVSAQEVREWLELQEWYQRAKEAGESDYSAVFRYFKPTHDHQIDYIKGLLRNAKTSAAYRGLAHLVHEGYFDLLLTTNFEQLAENCCRGLFQADARIRSISTADEFQKITVERDRCQVCYLHGNLNDYSLANLDEHTRFLRAEIQEAMKRLLNPYALVVVGYSGNDRSVMSLLDYLAKSDPSCFRRGAVYWCRPPGVHLSAAAKAFLDAVAQGFEVEVHGFDRLIQDLCKLTGVGLQMFEESPPPGFAAVQAVAAEPAVLNIASLQRLPERLLCYRTGIKNRREIEDYRTEDSWWQATVKEGHLWLIGNPDELPQDLRDRCSESPEVTPITLAALADQEVWNVFAELVNKGLGKSLESDCNLRYWRGRYYYAKPKGADERSVTYLCRRRKAQRRVVWLAFERGTEDEKTRYFCHEAIVARIRHFRGQPVLGLSPTRLFTVQGDEVWDSRTAETSIGRSTGKVWNLNFDSLVRAWLDILGRGMGAVNIRFSADGRKPEYRLAFHCKPLTAKRVQE